MTNCIEIKGLSKSYGDFALKNIDLTLPGGSILGLIGENGAGKTTTIKCILNLIRRDAGEITVLGHDNIREEKLANFNRLTALQDQISEEKHAAYVGKTVRCLLDGLSDDARYDLTARTPGNRLVRVVGASSALGQFRDVKITGANKWSLFGELI